MRLRVTQQHIDKGERATKFDCPLALALQDAGYKDARVMPYLDSVLVSFSVPSPMNAACFTISDATLAVRLNHYDESGEMEEFEVELPMNNRGRMK